MYEVDTCFTASDPIIDVASNISTTVCIVDVTCIDVVRNHNAAIVRRTSILIIDNTIIHITDITGNDNTTINKTATMHITNVSGNDNITMYIIDVVSSFTVTQNESSVYIDETCFMVSDNTCINVRIRIIDDTRVAFDVVGSTCIDFARTDNTATRVCVSMITLVTNNNDISSHVDVTCINSGLVVSTCINISRTDNITTRDDNSRTTNTAVSIVDVT